jgi:hypothetical protein
MENNERERGEREREREREIENEKMRIGEQIFLSTLFLSACPFFHWI